MYTFCTYLLICKKFLRLKFPLQSLSSKTPHVEHPSVSNARGLAPSPLKARRIASFLSFAGMSDINFDTLTKTIQSAHQLAQLTQGGPGQNWGQPPNPFSDCHLA